MRRIGWLLAALPAALFMAAPLRADSNLPPAPLADTQLADPAAEARAQSLMETLRCVTCQSQSIADSNAEMAGDMRNEVRNRIRAGESVAAIRASMIARYGDYISYRPEISAITWPLFVIPAIFALVIGFVLIRRVRARG